jgi:hypothetical protein
MEGLRLRGLACGVGTPQLELDAERGRAGDRPAHVVVGQLVVTRGPAGPEHPRVLVAVVGEIACGPPMRALSRMAASKWRTAPSRCPIVAASRPR